MNPVMGGATISCQSSSPQTNQMILLAFSKA
uniref:Uncharacterized protein n=1 Tax=Anguilla anguilla TaxID=7936 RepID=A0A0E9TVD9_ANGAN